MALDIAQHPFRSKSVVVREVPIAQIQIGADGFGTLPNIRFYLNPL